MSEYYTPKQYVFTYLWSFIDFLEREFTSAEEFHLGDLGYTAASFWTAVATIDANGRIPPQQAEELLGAYDAGLSMLWEGQLNKLKKANPNWPNSNDCACSGNCKCKETPEDTLTTEESVDYNESDSDTHSSDVA